MKLYQFAFVPFAMLAAACGTDGASISIVGAEPADQAASVADLQCDAQVRCGQVHVEFTFVPETETYECTGTIEDVTYDACYSETEADYLDLFENCELTAEDEQSLENCFNALSAESCISQAELDAYVEACDVEAEIRPLPAACDGYYAILEGCSTPA